MWGEQKWNMGGGKSRYFYERAYLNLVFIFPSRGKFYMSHLKLAFGVTIDWTIERNFTGKPQLWIKNMA